MKDLLLYIVGQIVTSPAKVSIEEKTVEGQVTFYITCATDDIGKIIGKKGKIIKAILRVLGVLAMKEGKHVNITMV